ncbi:MAG: hypothetical protein J6N72_10665 [Psychrobacter sp.]|nr:hypothetical protein [Psychrobacter sp.]
MSDNRRFTVIGWYHLGFFHPVIRRLVMIALTVMIAGMLIFYIVPFKYAVGVITVWSILFSVFLFIRRSNRF